MWKCLWLKLFGCGGARYPEMQFFETLQKIQGSWVIEQEWISAVVEGLFKMWNVKLEIEGEKLSCCFENLRGKFLHSI